MVTLPSLYEYYTAGGINSGLSVDQPFFTLNGRNISLHCGAMHYFRVPAEYWRDRLRKMRAAGLNCVETYVPWNLHEPEKGKFDFGDGGTDFATFLDIERFLRTTQEEDLFALVRPGPYICGEWDFGGMPSWLLREKAIKLRTSDRKFTAHVRDYFNVLLPLLAVFQFLKNGPIIGFQVENEYGSTEQRGRFKPDQNYLQQIRQLFISNGIKELLFTSDSPTQHGDLGALPGVLQTANFKQYPEKEFDKLKQLQPNKPIMAMEFWTGWFDHWGEKHHLRNNSEFGDVVERILHYPGSVNFYMFQGGTNWGFLNGANLQLGKPQVTYMPDTTSYDYDAPLTETGDYTEKYYIIKDLLRKYNNVKTKVPKQPQVTTKLAYNSIKIQQQLPYYEIIKQLPKIFNSKKLSPMELLPINNNSGQSFGYIVYRKKIDLLPNSTLRIIGHVYDSLLLLIDNKLISSPLRSPKNFDNFGYWRKQNASITLATIRTKLTATLDLVVENMGRNNFGHLNQFEQFKGLRNSVLLNDVELLNWSILPMEFKKKWVLRLKGWQKFNGSSGGPAIYRANLNVTGQPQDTFVNMRKWCRGIVLINGFNLGRFSSIGPQQTLYLPAPLLKKGDNELLIFEHFEPHDQLEFSKDPIYFTKQ